MMNDDRRGSALAKRVPDEMVTIEGLREKASNLIAAGRKADVVKILAKHRVSAIKDLPEKNYAAVDAALQALLDE